MSLIGVLVC
ncbi:hypothetical protein LINPERPRIM_LOCUS22339 [Linum perenne]